MTKEEIKTKITAVSDSKVKEANSLSDLAILILGCVGGAIMIFADLDDSPETLQIFYKELPTYNPQMTEGHNPVHSYTKHGTDGSCYGKTKVGISGGGSTKRYPRDVLLFQWDTQKSSLHATQKPVAACKYFIETYTNPGEMVLDSCSGSDTTAIAALDTGRKVICIENDEEIFNVGKNRVLNYIA